MTIQFSIVYGVTLYFNMNKNVNENKFASLLFSFLFDAHLEFV